MVQEKNLISKLDVIKLRQQVEETTSDYDKEKLQERLAKLAGGVAVIKVGGATEVEVKERKDRVEDALNSTRAAVEDGVVVGGGCALLYASQDLDKVKVKGADQKAGVDIVKKTLEAPIRQICSNAAVDGSVIVGKLLETNKPSRGYDVQAEEYCDMFEKGIIDPAKVVKTALQDAASIAGLLVMTEAMVADKPEEKDSTPAGMPPGGYGWHGWHGWHGNVTVLTQNKIQKPQFLLGFFFVCCKNLQ